MYEKTGQQLSGWIGKRNIFMIAFAFGSKQSGTVIINNTLSAQLIPAQKNTVISGIGNMCYWNFSETGIETLWVRTRLNSGYISDE